MHINMKSDFIATFPTHMYVSMSHRPPTLLPYAMFLSLFMILDLAESFISSDLYDVGDDSTVKFLLPAEYAA